MCQKVLEIGKQFVLEFCLFYQVVRQGEEVMERGGAKLVFYMAAILLTVRCWEIWGFV